MFFKRKKDTADKIETIETSAIIKSINCEDVYMEAQYFNFIQDKIPEILRHTKKSLTPKIYEALITLMCESSYLIVPSCEMDILHTLQFQEKVEHPCKKDVCDYYLKQGYDLKPDYLKSRDVEIIDDVKFYVYTVEIEYCYKNITYKKTLRIKKTYEVHAGDIIKIKFRSDKPAECVNKESENFRDKKIKEIDDFLEYYRLLEQGYDGYKIYLKLKECEEYERLERLYGRYRYNDFK